MEWEPINIDHEGYKGWEESPLKSLWFFNEAVGKCPSAALPLSLVTAAYFSVRLIPRDFGSLAYGHFPTAS